MRIHRAGLGLIFVLALPLFAQGDQMLSLEARPTFCMEPCEVRITVGVDRNEANRELLIEADSPDFYRSSAVQLDGETAPSVYTLVWKSLPAGRYQLRAMLRRASGDVTRTTLKVRVVGDR